jgi:peptidoglycan hydrolase CwlO-like protein
MGSLRTFLSILVVFTVLTALLLGSAQLAPLQATDACDQTCSKDSQNDNAYLNCINEKRACLESRIKETQTQKVTLNNTITIINGRVAVQELQIKQTEAEIERLQREIGQLTERISGLNLSLDRLSQVLVQRVQEHYKASRISQLLTTLSGENLSNMLSRSAYIEETGRQTAEAMERAETQRIEYDSEKILKEQKQTEVESKQSQLEKERSTLSKQREEQQYLLKETQNNEQRYQSELQKTLAEINAIQSIIAGRGNEGEGVEIKKGDAIASIISGASVCSNGTHLHFEVVKDKANRDPSAYLKPISAVWSNQPDGEVGFGGDWDWPLSDPARITQGYGMTYFARVRRAYGGAPHTGIDMVSKDGSLSVRSVRDGKLYRGSIKCGSGLLRYVRVDHGDGINTYYLHVNY